MRRILLTMTLIAVAAAASATGTHAIARPALRPHYCHGRRATIVDRSPGRVMLLGTKHRDVIWAGRGRDVIYGKGGNDLICAGAGNDVIDGMNGLDEVFGGAGTDWCLAWRHREHMHFHHQCEVHVQSPRHHHPAASGTGTPSTATASIAQPGARTAQRSGTCSSSCSSGTPACQTGDVNWPDTLGTDEFPTVTLTDSGYIWMWWTYDWENADGTFSYWNHSDYTLTDYLQPGSYNVRPTPQRVSAPAIPYASVGLVYVFFSYSADGQTWSPVQYSLATSYELSLTGGNPTGLLTGDCSTYT